MRIKLENKSASNKGGFENKLSIRDKSANNRRSARYLIQELKQIWHLLKCDPKINKNILNTMS